ncbi:unnamed protein product, partial [marine sediment metagenome]
MANETFNTQIYHSEVKRRMAFQAGFLADTFDNSGVAEFTSKKGATLNYKVTTIPTAVDLNVEGDHTITSYASTDVSMTLDGKQLMYELSTQEEENTAFGIVSDAQMNSVTSISEFVEYTIGDYLNLHVTNVAGSASTAITGLDDLAPATAFLSASKVPRIGRYAALHTTPYSVLASSLVANEQAQAESMRLGTIPQTVGLNFREAAYADYQIVNGEFGASALTVKAGVAAGLSALTITG